MWGEWLSCGPLLFMTSLGAQEKDNLSTYEWWLVFFFFGCLLHGFLINVASTYVGGVSFLTLSCAFYFPLLLLPFTDLFKDTHTQSHRIESTEKQEHRKKRKALCDLFTYSMPLFVLVYILSFLTIIDAAMTIILFQLLSLIVKGVYAAVLMDLYENAYLLAQAALSEERRANEARRAFLKYLFHEVRTPLNSLCIGIEVLDGHCQTDKEANESLTMMRGAVEFMSGTLNDVLSMQKIEEGKLDLDMRPFAFGDVISTVFATFKGAVVAKSLHLSSVLSPLLPARLLGDRFRLEHVLANLLSNAIKFSPVMGNISVDVSAEQISIANMEDFDDEMVVTVSVTDEGVGISEENQKKLFKAFFQISAGTQQSGGGSGLGLSLCKEIVSLHGGTIGVRSAEGHGSCFYFSIPFKTIPYEKLEHGNVTHISESNHITLKITSEESRSIRALVVDGLSIYFTLPLHRMNSLRVILQTPSRIARC